MKSKNFYEINLFEYAIFIHSLQLASGMLTMPSSLANTAGTNGWISIILGWVLTSIVGVLIIKTLQKNPSKNFIQILTFYFGKYLGNTFFILYSLYLFSIGFNILLKAIDIVNLWISPSTPAYQIALLLLLPFIILSRNGVRPLINYSLLVFFFTTWMPLLLLFSLKSNYNPLHLLPVLGDGIYPVLKALKETITPFAGLEISYFIYPFLQNKSTAVKGVVLANTITMTFYLFGTLLSYLYFSPEGIKDTIYPVFHLLKGIRFTFIERLEIIYIGYYLLVFSTTIYPYFYFFLQTSGKVIHQKVYNKLLLIFPFLVACIFLILHPDVTQLSFIYSLIDILNLIFFIILPTLLFIYCIIYHRFNKRSEL